MASEAKGIAELLAELRTWVAALEAAEAEREQAEEALHRAHADLERRVQERTAALAASEERLRTLYEAVSGAVLVWDAAGELVEANEAAQQTFGLTHAQMVGRRWEALWSVKDEEGAIVPIAERPAMVALRTGHPVRNFRIRITRPTGADRWLQGNAIPLRGATGETCQVVTTCIDVTERRRAEALTAAQKQVLELIATGAPLANVLEALVRLLEAQSPAMLCSILLLDPDGLHLRHGAAPNLPESYNRLIDGLAIGPSVGSCGTAAFRREAVIVSDTYTDPLWADYRELAREHGLRACWSTPIFATSGRVLGTFAMYYRKPRDPSAGDFELIEAATHIAGIAIERAQVEEALHQAKRAEGRLEGVLLTGRELAHLLNNDLAIAVGALEIIQHRIALPADLAQVVRDGLAQLGRAAQHIEQLQQVSRVETRETPQGPSLDLQRSSEPAST
jgi:PAS domain S-box-containing protein